MLNLDPRLISAANAASQFDAGAALAREAERVHADGLAEMQAATGAELTERQAAIFAERAAGFRDLVEKAYSDNLRRRAAWMPWTVCGPARYNVAKNNARADAAMKAARDWAEKIARYIENTRQMIRDAIPLADVLQEYRDGKRRDAIPADDPHAAEKLAARIDGMKERHAAKIAQNAYFRQHGTLAGAPGLTEAAAADATAEMRRYNLRQPWPAWNLQNENAEIRRLDERLQAIRRNADAGETLQQHNGFALEIDGPGARVNIRFDEKPAQAARDLLKKYGFRWSPREKTWTRKLTANARWDVSRLVPALQALPEYTPAAEAAAPADPVPAADPAPDADQAPAADRPAPDPGPITLEALAALLAGA